MRAFKPISLGNVLIYSVLILLTLSFLLPFLVIVSTSVISEQEYARRGGYVLYPEAITFTAYEILLGRSEVLFRAYQVTFWRVTLGAGANLIFTTLLAYALAQRQLPGRTPLTLVVFFTMVFSGGLIPSFLLIDFLGLRNTFIAMLIPGFVNGWYMLILRNYFMSLPSELIDAARMDGASNFHILTRIVLPLSLPVLATIGLFYAVYHWNEWFYASVFIDQPDLQPVQIILRQMLERTTMDGLDNISFMERPPPPASLRSALIVISTVPIVLVYPFIQRFFVKGIMVGGVKG